jgi:hypothetical protein
MARITEFDVRTIDVDGDVIGIDAFATMPEAIRFAKSIAPKFPAVVVERRHMESSIFGDAVEYVDSEVVWHAGSEAALLAWGG